MTEKPRDFPAVRRFVYEELTRIEEKVDARLPTQYVMYLDEKWEKQEKKLAELEGSLNEAYIQIAEVDSRNKIKELEEKLDTVDDRLSKLWEQEAKRLDSQAMAIARVGERLDKLSKELEAFTRWVNHVHGLFDRHRHEESKIIVDNEFYIEAPSTQKE